MIEPVHITTNNVARELLRIAAQNSVPVSHLCVEVSDVKTYVKDANSEFVEILESDFDKYKDEDILRDKTVEFEQQCSIEIKPIPSNYPFKEMICEIEFEQNNTLAYLVIKKGSKLRYYRELYSDFVGYIIEQKVRSNIVLTLFDTEYKKSIKSLIDVVEKVKILTFKEDKKILLSKGVDEIKSVKSSMCMNIEENNDIGAEDSEGKVDYANRGFLLSCVEGEQLFEFSKPQQGKHGRNCKGEIIEVEIINLDVKPTFTVEDSIEVQDSFENIKYLSTRSGYLIKKGNQYDVANSIDVDEISFKTTGTINSDLDSEISINVIKDDPLEDAIEEGMNVKVQKLSIKGSIGPNTNIESREISIDGQTHNDSAIKCVNANIGLHKGKVTGRKVEVTTLEGGEIIADTAVVKNAVRGKIKARSIDIHRLGSHVIMEASDYIQIQKVSGEENKFIIDPSVSSGLDEKKEDDEVYLKNLEDELKLLIKKFKELADKVKKNMAQCEKIKATIIKNKKMSATIPSNLIKNFKTCKVMRIRYKNLKEDVEYKKGQYAKLKKKLSNAGTDILDVKITLNEPINGYNNIVYKLENPPREIELKTNESMIHKVFKLIEDEDGVLSIENVKQ